MRGFKACLFKDIRLFMGHGGIASLLLPLLLTLLLLLGFSDAAEGTASIQPFNIAVRDMDETPMSRILIDQLGSVEILDSLKVAKNESDEELISDGMAAILTIPKDYFYSVYSMEDYQVGIVLNGSMPVEAELFRSMVASVMEIIAANQKANRALYSLQYGDVSAEQFEQLQQEAATDVFNDALSRQQLFNTEMIMTDTKNIIRGFFFACVLSLICMFIPMSVLKTLPEEINLGILQRFKAAGGSDSAVFISKATAALLLSFIPAAAVTVISIPDIGLLMPLIVFILTFLAAFGLFFLIASILHGSKFFQLCCSLVILFSMAAGGVIYPRELLHPVIQKLGHLTIPYYTGLGMKLELSDAYLLWPLLAMAVLFTAAGAVVVRRRRRA